MRMFWTEKILSKWSGYEMFMVLLLAVVARTRGSDAGSECKVTQVDVAVHNSTFSLTYTLSTGDCALPDNLIGTLESCNNRIQSRVGIQYVVLEGRTGLLYVQETGSYRLAVLQHSISSDCFFVLGQDLGYLNFAVDYKTNELNMTMPADVRVTKVDLHIYKTHESGSVLCTEENDNKFIKIKTLESNQGVFHMTGPFNANDCLCLQVEVHGVSVHRLFYNPRVPHNANCLKPVIVDTEASTETRITRSLADDMVASLVVNQRAILQGMERECSPSTPGLLDVSQIREEVRELSGGMAEIRQSLADLATCHAQLPCTAKSVCVVDGRTYQDGEYHVDNNCVITKCRQGHLLRPQESSPIVDFYKLLAKNCVYMVERSLAWDAARADCVADGGDLYVAGDFEGIGIYVKGKYGVGSVWVGVKRRSWTDGRHVGPGEWASGEPNGSPDDCAYLDPATMNLRDDTCNTLLYFMCNKAA